MVKTVSFAGSPFMRLLRSLKLKPEARSLKPEA
jgi:hypothetical protein